MSTVQLLAPRILALPADVRRALARVYGPGWVVSDPWCKGALPGIVGYGTGPNQGEPWTATDRVFFPANPTASVAAVTGWALSACYAVITVRLQGGCADDHVAGRSTNG